MTLDMRPLFGNCSWCRCDPLRRHFRALDSGAARGQCAHAGDRRGDSGGRQGLLESAVFDHRHRRSHPVRCLGLGLGLGHRRRLRRGRPSLGARRVYRHVHLGARQCAYRTGRASRNQRRAQGCVSRRRHHRHAGRRLGTARRRRLLPAHAAGARRCGGGAAFARRSGVRRLIDFDFRSTGRRHFHQGRRRRCRPRRQSGSRYSGR